MFKFITHKTFLINLFIAILIIVLAIWQLLRFLDKYTNHGEALSVPNLEGLTIEEVKTVVDTKKLRFSILDSVFNEKYDRGVVLEQIPEANELVKENRTIYITVSKVIAPKITMPNVIDLSQRIAIAKLKSYGLKIDNIEWKPSEHVGIVLEHLINDKKIFAGDKIDEGSSITLVIGSGKGDLDVIVPYLINLTKEEAIDLIQLSQLSVGTILYNSSCESAKDTANAKVYKQDPIKSESSTLSIGSSIDLYFTCDTTMIEYVPQINDSIIND